MPKPLRVVLGTLLLVATVGLVTCQSVFTTHDSDSEQTNSSISQ